MEKYDHELIEELMPGDQKLKKLYSEHIKLEKEVSRFESYAGYSPSAALKQKEMKKAKLRGVEKIMTILRKHRGEDDSLQ